MPKLVELLWAEAGGVLTHAPCQSFHTTDSFLEAAGGVAEGRFGVDLTVAGEIDHGEENIPQFPGEGRSSGTGSSQFPQLFAKLGGNALFRVRPIETRAGGAPLKILGIEKSGQVFGDTIKAALAGRFFLSLQLMPTAEDLGRIAEFFPAEDVGMAADELVGQFAGNGPEIEGFPFAGKLGVEKDMQKNIPQFLLEGMVVSLIDGLQKLVHLLEDHGPEGAVGLFPVPRAAARATEPGHDPGEGLGFAHQPELRGGRRFVEPERDSPTPLVMITP